MDELIEALTIFAKYQKPMRCPTHCAPEVLLIMGVTKDEVSEEDRARLCAIGFHWDNDEYQSWMSFRFGSA